ncbi:fibronectin type III-like domain-contianing protein [Kitasatospora phosalacinea]|uniref:fibronectin type III-like domain-contianing protein n=1 Tax=Kitasatospora phosalacinea TaxID=2065 RepID=UPI0012FF3928
MPGSGSGTFQRPTASRAARHRRGQRRAAPRRLVGFRKVQLAKGAGTRAPFTVTAQDLSTWQSGTWLPHPGPVRPLRRPVLPRPARPAHGHPRLTVPAACEVR